MLRRLNSLVAVGQTLAVKIEDGCYDPDTIESVEVLARYSTHRWVVRIPAETSGRLHVMKVISEASDKNVPCTTTIRRESVVYWLRLGDFGIKTSDRCTIGSAWLGTDRVECTITVSPYVGPCLESLAAATNADSNAVVRHSVAALHNLEELVRCSRDNVLPVGVDMSLRNFAVGEDNQLRYINLAPALTWQLPFKQVVQKPREALRHYALLGYPPSADPRIATREFDRFFTVDGMQKHWLQQLSRIPHGVMIAVGVKLLDNEQQQSLRAP